MLPDESDGRRVRRLRKRAGLNQAELAARLGKTQPWVSQVECGKLVLDSISTINELAHALRAHPNEITGRPYRGDTPAEDRGHASILDIARQVGRHDLEPEWDRPIRRLTELHAAVQHVEELRTQTRYVTLGELIPDLLAELQAAASVHKGHNQEQVFALLVAAYRGADAVAYGLGYEHLSTLCTDRVRWAAARSGDARLAALGDYLRVRDFWACASWNDALQVLDHALAPLEREHDRGEPETLAVWGGLQLRAAITAARSYNADEAWGRLDLASDAINRLGDNERHDFYYLTSTRLNVAVHSVGVAVEMGDGVDAVRRGEHIRLPAGWPPSRAGYHYMDLSRGWLWYGNRERSLVAMENAERVAPMLVRNHPMAQRTVRSLVEMENRASSKERVRRLAHRMHAL